MADSPARTPQIITPKGLGPGFWGVTAVMALLSVVVGYLILTAPLDWILPGASNPAADRASDIDGLIKFMSVFGAAIFFFVAGYVIYFAVVFRRRADEPAETIGVQIHHAPKLEFWWTLLPSILLIVLMGLSINVWYKIQFGSFAPALTTEVVARQFNFEVRYPGLSASVFTPPGVMHLPAGRSVRILITSGDVLHHFWVPEFRLKAAAVPGLVQNLNLTPLHPGTYDIVCSEYCGLNHSKMQGKLVVESPQAFDRWIAGLKAHAAAAPPVMALASGDAAAGKALFAQKCSACHMLAPFDQKIVGPGLLHISTDPQHPQLVNGKAPTAANIAGILQDGFTGPIGTMPNRQALGLSDQDIANVAAFLMSLR